MTKRDRYVKSALFASVGESSMSALPQRPLLVLDGAYFAHRSFHSRFSEPREAFVDAVLRVIAQEQPDFLACAWDAEGPNYRHELYPDYKSNRPEKDPALVEHLRVCLDSLRSLGVAVYEATGFEGDDVIATLTRRWTERGGRAIIYTADKDILQLVDEDTRVVIGERHFRADTVVDQYGVPPHLVSAFLALAGDSADGIPGMPGIGPQSAARLLNEFGSLEALVAAAPESNDRRARAIVGREEELELFHKLTVLSEDVPMEVEDDDLICHVHPANVTRTHDQELWEISRKFQQSLDCYRERAFAYAERFALMHDAFDHVRERSREAKRAAARLQVQRGYHRGM